MTVGAATDAVTITLATIAPDPRRARRQHVPRRLQRLLRPAAAPRAQRGVPADGDGRRADERDHVDRARCACESVRAADLLLGHDAVGGELDRRSPRPPGRREGSRGAAAGARPPGRERRRAQARRRRARRAGRRPRTAPSASACASCPTAPRCASPAGTPVFDAASWNGIAIDSTCGGHGTCKKCKVRVALRRRADLQRRPARVHHRGAARRVAAGLPGRRARATSSSRCRRCRPVPRRRSSASGATSSCARRCRSATSCSSEPTLEDQRSDLQRVLDALDDLEPDASLELLRELGGVAAHRRTSTSPRSSATRS